MTKKLDILIYVILIVIVIVIALSFKGNSEILPQSIILDKKNITIYIGEKSMLKANIEPSNASNKTLSWKSNNPSVVSVDNNGIITSYNEGYADIVVSSFDEKINETCHVTVIARDVSKIIIDKEELLLNVGDKNKINAVAEPDSATYKKLYFKSTNENIVTVDNNGNIEAKNEGFAEIIVTDEKGKTEARCRVTVGVTLEKIEIESSLELIVGETKKLSVTYVPSNTTNKSITWKSNNTSIATIDSNGNVVAKAKGTTTVTVTGSNNKVATCKVTVKEKTKTKYIVKFNDINKSITREEGSKIGTLPSPTKSNNNFLGWYTKETGGTKVSGNTIVRSNMTLYAHWKQTVTVKDNLEMHFINGGGFYDDAILIRTNKATIFIDGGRGEAAVVKYLNELGVKTIDYVIGSHTEYDHIHAQGGVIKTFNVKNVIYPNSIYNCGCSCDSKDTSNVLSGLSSKGITARVQQVPSILTVGDMKLYFLAPWQIGCNKNENSFIFILKFKNNTFLFTGDSDSVLNNTQMLKTNMQKLGIPSSKVDMLKYPHHGNKYLLEETLAFFKPSFVIVPNMNAAKYPTDQMRGLVSKYSAIYRLSDSKTGNILVKSDGSRINVLMDVVAMNYAK